jgi:hypothetical protein
VSWYVVETVQQVLVPVVEVEARVQAYEVAAVSQEPGVGLVQVVEV